MVNIFNNKHKLLLFDVVMIFDGALLKLKVKKNVGSYSFFKFDLNIN